jgi:hypothetical protein
LLAIIAAMLGIYIVASLWNSYQETRDRAAWDDYQLAVFSGDVEQKALQRLAASEDHAGTDMQEWALMGWADRQLLRASQLYLSNRDESNDRLVEIMGVYEQYATGGSHPEVRNRARLGLARAYEMKNDLKAAKAQYQQVEGALADVAAERLKELESKPAEETAKWLATVELPEPKTPTGPGTPGSRPGFEATSPPTDPAAKGAGAAPSLEEILGGIGKGGEAGRYDEGGMPAEPASDTPASAVPTEGAAANATPAAETAPAETPAPGETPAADAAAETSAEPAAEEPAEEPAAAAGSSAKQ